MQGRKITGSCNVYYFSRKSLGKGKHQLNILSGQGDGLEYHLFHFQKNVYPFPDIMNTAVNSVAIRRKKYAGIVSPRGAVIRQNNSVLHAPGILSRSM